MLNPSKLRYSISQAKKNVARNGLMSVASLFTTTCCLLILGLFTALTLNVNYWTEQVKGAGAEVVNGEGLIANEAPSDDELENCRSLGQALVK